MIRILLVARYRDATMNRKIELLARQPDLTLWHICPRLWQDELIRVEQSSHSRENPRQIAVAMIGPSADPHRAFYRTLTFAMPQLRPHLIHAEEEPDSLAALQIALARRVFAPRAKLALYTWQNINRPRRRYVRSIMQAALRASDAVLCASQEAAEVLRQLGYSKIVAVLPAIGVDTQTFVPRPRRPDEQGAFMIGYVGRLVGEKGIDTLIAAVAHLKQHSVTTDDHRSTQGRDIKLLIIGGGPYRSELEAQVWAFHLADHVQFIPAMSTAQIALPMSQFDVLVLPSRASTQPIWKEQFGRVLIEAMACKVPVVGSDSGAIPEVIGDAGLIFPAGDAAALADCLSRLMQSPSLRNDLAKRGYARAMQHYTQDRIAARTAEFYRQLISASELTR